MPKTIFGGDHAKLIEVLIAARKKVGLTQEELASRIARDQTFISLIERSQRRLDVIEFISLAKAMGIEPVALFVEVMERIGR